MLSIEKMIELYEKNGGCHNQVAKELKCSREYVRQKLTPLGYPAKGKKNTFRPKGAPFKYTHEYLREIYAKAEGNIGRMAMLAGVASATISVAIRRSGISHELTSASGRGRPRKKVA